ncbi:hypothetical protein Bequi_00900 [Brachybacterium sp. JHP9]|uniref:GIY-YIG nuclease family protein n=1 Tax=Brachybacterium equifaecis TaxID=2910770 RepID=A0ABT0QWI1_9MICO|nr:hypothetical protein [Brachybacterium equifaecis]MCL6421955.1 hypothetical protein [Brachybacterium equifaecis]
MTSTWTRAGLTRIGFRGFVPFADLLTVPVEALPNVDGVYVVIRDSNDPPVFLEHSIAGHFKGRDPTVTDLSALERAWVSGAHVLYIGKAAIGKAGRRGLRKRLEEYRRFGDGEPVGHSGGRLVWQMADHADLLVAWCPTPGRDPEEVETQLLDAFVDEYGKIPFANLRLGKRF